MSTTVVEFENQDVIVVEMSGRGPIGPRGRQGEPGPAGPSEWGVIQGNISDQTDLQDALDAKADVGASYTKSEEDALLAQKADADSVYTKTETDALLADKADTDDVYSKTEVNTLLSEKADSDTVYTKTETDTLLGAKADVGDSYTKAEEDILLNAKANSADVYTKTETDTLLADKADADDVYTKDEVDDALADKADSADVYTKDETDALLLDKAPVILSNASGSIASFTDGSPAPVTALTVSIEPVQDLHGYDYPFPPDGHPNDYTGQYTLASNLYLIPDNNHRVNEQVLDPQRSIIMPCSSGTQYRVRSGISGTMRVGSFTTSPVKNSVPNVFETATDNSNPVQLLITTGANDKYLFIQFFIDGDVTERGATFEGAIGGFYYAPYSNICPISGHDTAVVTRTGKNLLNIADYTSTSNARIVNTTGVYLKAGTYTVSFDFTTTGTEIRVQIAVKKDSTIAQGNYTLTGEVALATVNCTEGRNQATLVCPQEGYLYMRIIGNGASVSNIQAELSSTASAYEAPSIQTVTIDLNGTRYGGELNVLTGEMTVDRAYIELDGSSDENWSTSTWSPQILTIVYYSTNIITNVKNRTVNLSNMFVPKEFNYLRSNDVVGITFSGQVGTNYVTVRVPTQYNTVSAWETFLSNNPLQVVYPLATPFTVQLTPSQLSTLLGQNNIWADTGDTEVTYRTDTKLYIDSKVAQTAKVTRKMIADSATADGKAPKSLATGDLIIVGDELRKATANIGNGSAITASNSTTATLADVIKALQ